MTPERNPKSSVHQVLGDEQIGRIYQSFGLTPEDGQIVDRIFQKWEGAVGDPEKKMLIAAEEVGENPRGGQIARAILTISREFILQNPTHPLSRYARKAPNN